MEMLGEVVMEMPGAKAQFLEARYVAAEAATHKPGAEGTAI